MTGLNVETRSYLSKINLEVDERGWIAGTSRASVDVAYDAAGSWNDILLEADSENRGIQSIDISSGFSLDNRALLRPESPTMNVVLNTPDRMDNMYNKNIRLTYDHPTLGTKTLFTGRVINAATSISVRYPVPGVAEKVYQTTLECASVITTQLINSYLYNFTAPQEPVIDRIARINTTMGINVDSDISGFTMAACTAQNISVFDALMECATASFGIFGIATDGSIYIKATEPAPAVIYTLSDVTGDGFEYGNLQFNYGADDVVSSVIATAKSDSTKFRTLTDSGASAINQESITVDCPAVNANLDAWLASFPFKSFVSLVPISADVKFHEDNVFAAPILGATLYHEGNTYMLGIKNVRHSIGKYWRTRWDFMDVRLITHPVQTTPSAPRSIVVTDNPAFTTATYTWSPPFFDGAISGYEIRRATGTVPPTKTGGTLVGTKNVNDTRSITDFGLSHGTKYTIAIWATTPDVGVYSPPVTKTFTKA